MVPYKMAKLLRSVRSAEAAYSHRAAGDPPGRKICSGGASGGALQRRQVHLRCEVRTHQKGFKTR